MPHLEEQQPLKLAPKIQDDEMPPPILTTTTVRRRFLIIMPFFNFNMSTESYSLLLLLISSVCLSIMGSFVKLVTSTGFKSSELVFIRAIAQGSVVLLAMFWCKMPNSCVVDGDSKSTTMYRVIRYPLGRTTAARRLVIIRGILGGLGFVLYYYTYSVLPLGDAQTLLSLSPIVTILAASVFLNEPATMLHLLAAVASIVGSVFIARPAFLFGSSNIYHESTTTITTTDKEHKERYYGHVTALLGTCCMAGVILLIRKAGKSGNIHTLQLLLSFSVFGTMDSFFVGEMLPYLSNFWSSSHGEGKYFINDQDYNDYNHHSMGFEPPTSAKTYLYIMLVILIGGVQHFLMNYAGQMAPAGLSSVVQSSSILFSYVLELVVFKQMPTQTTIFGVAMVCVSLVFVALLQKSSKVSSSTTGEKPHLWNENSNMSAAANSSLNPRKNCSTYGAVEPTIRNTEQQQQTLSV